MSLRIATRNFASTNSAFANSQIMLNRRGKSANLAEIDLRDFALDSMDSQDPEIDEDEKKIHLVQKLLDKLYLDWNDLTPFLNAHVKVIIDGDKTTWMLVWTKDAAIISKDNPVLKGSLVYKYLTSDNEKKKELLNKAAQLIASAFWWAEDFVDGQGEVQTGFEIVDDYFHMCVLGMLGIEVNFRPVDKLLIALKENNENKINELKVFFKSCFAHEMTHALREEIYREEKPLSEIASHAVEILASGDKLDVISEQFDKVIYNVEDDYDQDMVAALKVVAQSLSSNPNITYVPKDHKPVELLQAMESIPEDKRYDVLKEIATEIIYTDSIELLRIAAEINVIPQEFTQELKEAS